jgi:histone chaperone ASF1
MGGAEETTGSTAATGATEKIDEGAESEDLEADSSGESDEEDEGEGEGEADDDVEMADQDMEDAEPASGAPTGVAKPEL